MKLSIAWIFSHIEADWEKIDLNDLVDKFNKTTAEIESFKKINTNLNNLLLAKVISPEKENVILYCSELKKEIEIPKRDNIIKDEFYLLAKEDNNFRWATTLDLGSDKLSYLPAFNVLNDDWKKGFESEDYVLEIDNKSITHRPDLWSHRGIAREIAAILNLNLKPIDKLITQKHTLELKDSFKGDQENPFASTIKDNNSCKRFATYYIKDIQNAASDLLVSTRLSRVESKPINAIVDATNYVMLDLSQPMHAFDANKIQGKTISPRLAIEGEKLTLLDGQTIELTSKDIIIADQEDPIALAGIMGGKNTQVSQETTSILIEAANFNSTQVRLSSLRHKIRTEASARFEKSLDLNQNTLAIERFLNILKSQNLQIQSSENIVSLGDKSKEIKIVTNNEFIQNRLGTKIDPTFVVKTLEKLDFKIKQNNENYEITVPSFRSTKDVLIPEDIVEEIGRFFGYGNIPFVLPSKQMMPSSLKTTMFTRKIKQVMAFSCNMHEVENYPFYDEAFLNEISWSPKNPISVTNPVSQNWKLLVTSLIPHLLKNVQQNLSKDTQLNFFELNKIWQKVNKDDFQEKKSLAGIFFSHKSNVDFYEAKSKLEILFSLLKISIHWEKNISEKDIWYSKCQTADLMYENKKIGTAGKISLEFLNKIAKGDAFLFELDANFLLEHNPETHRYRSLSKYQNVWLDISIFVNLQCQVAEIIKIIKESDLKIYKVELIDSFEKDEWQDKKSLTFRYYFIDESKTMTKEEIDNISSKVQANVNKIGAQLR